MKTLLANSRLKPFAHQITGVETLVRWNDPDSGRTIGGVFFLTDEMGLGKTKQCIDTAQILFLEEKIDKVLVIAPAPVRDVWFNPEFGQLVEHCWERVPNRITQYHSSQIYWDHNVDESKRFLEWTITNYEFVRSPDRYIDLRGWCDDRTLLILDESSAIKSFKAKQTRACKALRKKCGRVILLNGAPVIQGPGDLFSQAEILSPEILGCKNWWHFRAIYAIMGGWKQKQIIGWRNVEEIQRRLAPYVLRRLKVDCLDLPPKLPSINLTVTLSPKTWSIYKEMREEMVAWLSDVTVGSASQAAVRSLRLSQITSGFLGGVIETPTFEEGEEFKSRKLETQEIGHEKLDLFHAWLKTRLEENPELKLLVWARFRPEVARLYNTLNTLPGQLHTGIIWGGQKREERDYAKRLLNPETTPDGPVVVVGTPATGALGLNLQAAYCVIYVSNDFNLKTRIQSEDRVHRPGQTHPVSYFDIVAVGPKGQKTIDTVIIRALQKKEDVANWTTSAWLKELQD